MLDGQFARRGQWLRAVGEQRSRCICRSACPLLGLKEYDVLTVVKTLIHISVSEHSGCAMMRIIQQRVSRVQSPGTLDRETRGRATDGTTADFSQDGPGPLPPRAAQSQPRHGCHAVALAAPSPSSTLGGGSGAAEAGRYPPS